MPTNKPLFVIGGELKTPPMSELARREAGFLIRRLQIGYWLSMPHARPMPSIGARVHELRIHDAAAQWRIICRIDDDAIVVAAVFEKKTRTTPGAIVDVCKRRFAAYDAAGKEH